MLTITFIILGAVLITGILHWKYNFIKSYFKWRGKRLITCPRDETAAGVEVDAKQAALAASFGERYLTLKDCTHWPERQDCGQQCLEQIESSPESCLVRNVFLNWYHDKTCVYCGSEFTEINWHDHKPAFRSPDGKFIEWSETPVEKIPRVLETHQPVCWNCYIAENFRQEHPELVVDRERRGGNIA